MKILKLILRYLLLFILCFFLYQIFIQGALFNLYRHPGIISYLDISRLTFYGISCGIFLILHLAYFKKPLSFWEIFIHEITHVLFAILFFKKVKGFSVSKNNGVTSYTGKTNWLIILAPWFFPLLAWLFLFVGMFINDQYRSFSNHVIAVSLTWHLITLFRSFSIKEKDLQEYGFIFSLFFIISANTANLIFFIFYLDGRVEKLVDLSLYVITTWRVPWM